MKKKYLKAAAYMAAMALAILSHAHPAHAAGTQGVPVTVNYADTQEARAPSVMIPREIYLKDETQCSYEVWAYCPKDELGALFDTVAVTPSESFTLTNERTGATFTGSATQGKTEFLPDDVKGGEACEVGGVQAMRATAQGNISVDGIPQGRWTGAVVFTVDGVFSN